jgi:hypothetical protein
MGWGGETGWIGWLGVEKSYGSGVDSLWKISCAVSGEGKEGIDTVEIELKVWFGENWGGERITEGGAVMGGTSTWGWSTWIAEIEPGGGGGVMTLVITLFGLMFRLIISGFLPILVGSEEIAVVEYEDLQLDPRVQGLEFASSLLHIVSCTW